MSFKNIFLIFFFMTLPLYLTDDFRLNISNLSITFNFLILLLSVFIIIFYYGNFKLEKSVFIITIFLVLLLLLHIINFNNQIDNKIFIKYNIKFFSVLLVFILSYFISKNFIISKNQIIKWLTIFIIISSLILLYLIFYYLSLKSLALGNKFFNPHLTKSGKNQLQIYLAITVPVNYYLIGKSKNILIRILLLFSLLINFISIIYVGSRGLWVTLGVIILGYFLIYYFKIIIRLKINKKLLINLIILFLIGILIIPVILKKFETGHIIEKFKSFYYLFEFGSSNVDVSINERSYLFFFGIDRLSEKPLELIKGFGLGSFQTVNPYLKLTHNDYLFFLHDLGIFSLLLIITVFYLILKEMKRKSLPLYICLPFMIDLVFINAYNFLLFWIITGLFLGLNINQDKLIS